MTKITPLDVNWCNRPKTIAAALLESENHAALIDPGPESTLTTLREQLSAHGLAISDLNTILLTHIHLDHAGVTGTLVRENPKLKVFVHANGARHMADPSKLIASATRLWGDQLPILFGETLPVPQENLQILEGGETLTLGSRKLDVAYTPGHASHHVSYFDSDEGVAFIGDTGGIRIDNSPYIYPATPPPDIDLTLWDQSFKTILDRNPTRLFLTHFAWSNDPAAHIAEFHDRLHRWLSTAEKSLRAAVNFVARTQTNTHSDAKNPSTSAESGAPVLKPQPTASDAATKELEAKIEVAAMGVFIRECTAEMESKVSPAEADHYAFTAGLDLSFRGLSRALRKRTEATARQNPEREL
jgi:glyoxylase-like metal-dependent hydrolase (beta-lactamase superfamily II)